MSQGLVAVVAGGLSHERDVSLASGRNLVRELRAAGVDVASYDFDRNLLHNLERDKAVVAMPALHGQFGEDGEIQTLLELIGLPYVGSTARACRVTFDKGTARELLRRAEIPVPHSVGLSAQTFRDIGASALMEHVLERLGERVVVKPTRCGSPPDSVAGRAAARLPRPTHSSISATGFLNSLSGTCETRNGNATLSKAERCGTSRKSWKTVPMRRRKEGRPLRGRVITSLPNMRIMPREGRCAR